MANDHRNIKELNIDKLRAWYPEGFDSEHSLHRFDRLRKANPKEWEFLMYRCCTDKDGNPYGWGKVLDYIGVGWEDIPPEQITLEEWMEDMYGLDN